MRRLKGVDARLVSVLKGVVKDYDITILEGMRTKDRQKELMAKGASKTMKSKHIEGKAVDCAPYPLPNWEDVNEFIFMAGRICQEADRLGVPIRWVVIGIGMIEPRIINLMITSILRYMINESR